MKLPDPDIKDRMSVEEALSRRRSVRRFRPEALPPGQIGQLCWAAQGITNRKRGLRTAPSAGATYPLEVYVFTSEGVFHYEARSHELVKRHRDDLRADLAAAALSQQSVELAPVVLVFTAVYERTETRYKDRARRYVHMEAGHAAQNVLLQAVAMGLGGVPVGAFSDDRVAVLLELREDESPLYIIPVGRPAS